MAIFEPIEIIFSVILTLVPVILTSIPYLLTRKREDKIWAILYNRFFIAYVAFYFMYFIFAGILNAVAPNPDFYLQKEYYPSDPKESAVSTIWKTDFFIQSSVITIPVPILFRYMFQFILNSIILFLQYPIVILAFVFVVSPFISWMITIYQIKKQLRIEQKPIKASIRKNNEEIKKLTLQLKNTVEEDKKKEIQEQINILKSDQEDLARQLKEIPGLSERIREIQYEMEKGPFQQIIERVKAKDWSNEKELLKILIAILPITLFILMTILNVLGEEENPSLLQGTTVGWFLEIFFAYIATVVFAVYLLKSSRISRKGKFLGEQLYLTMVQSLMTVGAFMSVLAVVLFLVQFPQQLPTITYFVVYFIMVSLFFVVFLDIFEPFSSFLLIKLIEGYKNLNIAIKSLSLKNLSKTATIGVIIALIMSAGFAVAQTILEGIFKNFNTLPYLNTFWFFQNFSSYLIIASLVVLTRRWNWSVLINGTVLYISAYATTLFVYLWYTESWWALFNLPAGFPNFGGVIFTPPFLSAIPDPNFSDIQWLTSVFRLGEYNGIKFVVPELHKIPVIWKGEGLFSASTFLFIASLPYNILHPFTIVCLYGMVFFYIHKPFTARKISGEEKVIYRLIYSPMPILPSLAELTKKSHLIYIKLKSDLAEEEYIKLKKFLEEKHYKPDLFDIIKDDMVKFEDFAKKSGLSIKELHKILDEIIYNLGSGHLKTFFEIYFNEFSYSYIEVKIDSLHVMMLDGRACMSHNLAAESQVEPALVAGLFSAITSFAKEAVRSEQLLRTIDHGDVVLTIEYGKWVFAAIFADRTNTELRKKLIEFLQRFEARHEKDLPAWLGDMDLFKDDIPLAEEIFGKA